MWPRSWSLVTILIVVITAPVRSQSTPRTRDGHPDLQGMYDLATLTPLERPAGVNPMLSAEEAARLEKAVAERMRLLALPSRTDRGAPPVGGDGSKGAAGNVGDKLGRNMQDR